MLATGQRSISIIVIVIISIIAVIDVNTTTIDDTYVTIMAMMAVRTSVCTHVRNDGDGDGGDDVEDDGGDACGERVPDVQPCTSGTRSRRATLHVGNARKLNKL